MNRSLVGLREDPEEIITEDCKVPWENTTRKKTIMNLKRMLEILITVESTMKAYTCSSREDKFQ